MRFPKGHLTFRQLPLITSLADPPGSAGAASPEVLLLPTQLSPAPSLELASSSALQVSTKGQVQLQCHFPIWAFPVTPSLITMFYFHHNSFQSLHFMFTHLFIYCLSPSKIVGS